MTKLTINTIFFKDEEEKYFSYLFESLQKQTFKDWQLQVLDNGASPELIGKLKGQLDKLDNKSEIIHSDKNIGFANGHNLLYKKSDSEYVLMLNPDMYLQLDVLEKLVKFLDQHKEVATASTRLMRWDFAKLGSGGDLQASFTNQIDAIGIRLLRNRRAIEWLAQQEWKEDSENKHVKNLYNKSIVEVFGVSGALPIYRKSQIDNVLLPDGNVFDPTYHSYKEDLDLAYRLRNMGYTSYVLLDAVVYHDRTGAAPKKMGDWSAIKNYKKHSKYIRFHSYKNHLRTLYKNEYWQNLLLDLPFIFWFEFKKFVFLLSTSPSVIFVGWKEILQNYKYTRKAKKDIKQKRKMYWKGLRRWFSI